jgi:hypothetical protein
MIAKGKKQKRPLIIRTSIIGFEIIGSLYILFAIQDTNELAVEFGNKVFAALALSIPLFIVILFWFNFFARFFSKSEDLGIKIVIVFLLFLPFFLHYALSRIAETMDVWTYSYHLLDLLKSLITAGFWYSLSIWLRKTFSSKLPTAENTPQDSQSTLV